MSEVSSSGITGVVRKIIRLIVEEEYEALVRLTDGQRLTADEIREGFAEYPFGIVMPPEEKLAALIDVIPIRGSENFKRYSVWVCLWTAEEGRSDLQLRLTLRPKSKGYESR